MKYCLLLLLSSAIVSTGCSSSQTSDNRVAIKPGVNAAANSQQKVDPSVPQTTANSPQTGTTGTATIDTVTGVEVPTTVENPPETAQGTLAAGRKRLVDVPQTGPTPPPNRTPAGENSEMTTTMDKQARFVETRYFKTDKVLSKVERTWLSATDSTIKYTLRNGKEFSASGAKIPDLSRATVVDLLANAGVTPAAPKAKPSSANDPTGAKQ